MWSYVIYQRLSGNPLPMLLCRCESVAVLSAVLEALSRTTDSPQIAVYRERCEPVPTAPDPWPEEVK